MNLVNKRTFSSYPNLLDAGQASMTNSEVVQNDKEGDSR